MRSYSLIAPAKINLHLEIIGDRPDRYHELAMVLQGIDLADQIDINANGTDQFRLHCDHPEVPADESNLAYKAAKLMAQEFPDAFEQYGGANIAIHKHIPVGAGLAGGSTNGAAVLVGLDLIWGLGLTQGELQDLAARLGSDVPFCIAGGTAIATGRGEQLSPLPGLDSLYAVLAKYRSLSVSTAWAYQTYRKQFGDSYPPIAATGSVPGTTPPKQRAHAGEIVSAIMQHDGAKIGKLLHNDLEKVVLPAYPQVTELRETLQQFNPLGAMMSGSGPTVFALAESQKEAEYLQQQIQAALPDPDLQTWVTRFRAGGIQIV
ncbi:MAG: 4-(cytidine 5'-diphospho)-2-C-methyl-D-erythritol kinase [Leptolyngbyaceae cyanobacterium SM1_4_3]|nr:4-(cytidine 5'-diphospho)-2-C-methyl-D-erythritol kinase [Leptolyngbyaceae cyanobacterium SM1_4_3]